MRNLWIRFNLWRLGRQLDKAVRKQGKQMLDTLGEIELRRASMKVVDDEPNPYEGVLVKSPFGR